MKKGLNRDHQQQLQHHQNFNLSNSSFPFNNYNNQPNIHHSQAPRHHFYNNSIPQVQSQFTSLSLSSQQSRVVQQQQQQSRNTSSPNTDNVVGRPTVQSQAERWVPHSIKNVQQKSLSAEEHNQATFRKVRG